MSVKTFILPFLISIQALNAAAPTQYGLTFKAHAVIDRDSRTSLDINDGASFDFPEGFSMEFDLKLMPAYLAYGYVFRMISDDKSSFDLITNLNLNKLNFVLIESSNELYNIEFKTAIPQQWVKIKIALKDNSIRCAVDSISQTIPITLPSLKHIKIYFGSNEHPVFHTTDVSPMTVRNLILRNSQGKPVRYWRMDKHGEKEVYDEIANRKALVKNGIWDIDRHLKWTKVTEIPLPEKNAQIACDSVQARLFIATSDSLMEYAIETNRITAWKTKKGAPVKTLGGSQMIYDYKSNRLISYSIMHPNLLYYDFAQKEWSGDFIEDLPPIQHHNRFIDPETDRLLVFGGYGMHTYHNDLWLHSLNESGEWRKYDYSHCITPRYLSAIGYWGDGKLIVMGGFGSLSGKQEEYPQSIYDVNEIDFRNNRCRKIGQLSGIKEPLAFGHSMIIEKPNRKLYALTYNNGKYHTHISLLSLNMETMEYSFQGDTIPYHFLDTESFCDLFLHRRTATMYAVVLHKGENTDDCLQLYSLAYPPLKMSDVLQTRPDKVINDNSYILITIAVLLLFALGAVVYLRKRKNKASESASAVQRNTGKFIETRKTSSTIFLLGGFQVFDKNGNDITDSFTPNIKAIFLFLLLNTLKDKKITSEKLDETFYLGMDKLSAMNNRSVNITRLRVILENLGDVEVLNKSSYWHIHLGEDIVCDYGEAITLLRRISNSKTVCNKADIQHILKLVSGGLLLPNLNYVWADDYKSEYTDLINDVLMKAVIQPEIRNDNKLLQQIANVILLHDSLDEDAIRLKCLALFNMGQKGAAKQCFDKFYAEYSEVFNEKPKFKFEDIFSGTT
jgi:two-component SAPR family response regulator